MELEVIKRLLRESMVDYAYSCVGEYLTATMRAGQCIFKMTMDIEDDEIICSASTYRILGLNENKRYKLNEENLVEILKSVFSFQNVYLPRLN